MNHVAIIVPLWNQVTFTKKFIQSLYEKTEHKDFTLILIDNNSTDKTPKYLKMIEKVYKNLHIITLPENTGYVGGINKGLEFIDKSKDKPQYVLFGNNDVEVTDKWLEKMLGYFKEYEDLGGLGPISNNVAGPQHVTWNDRFGEKLQTVKYIIGFWALFPFAVVEKVGKLDDRFGMGFSDDIDYSIRVREAGYALGIARDTMILHHGSASYKQLHNAEAYKKDLEEKHAKLIEKWGETTVAETMRVEYYHGTIAFSSQEVVPVEFTYSLLHMLNRSTEWIHVYNGKSTIDMKVKNETLNNMQGKWLLYLHHHAYFKDTLLDEIKAFALKEDVEVVIVPFEGDREKRFAAIYMTDKAISKLPDPAFMYMKHNTEDDYFIVQCTKFKVKYAKYTPMKHVKDVQRMDEYKPSVLSKPAGTIGIPCMNHVHSWFLVSMFKFLCGKKEQYKIVMTNNEQIDTARNHIVEEMQGDWVWFIDSDQTFPELTVRTMLQHNHPIVGAMVYKKKAPYLPCVYMKAKEGYGYHALMFPFPGQPFYADMTGTGCLLIKKEVFSKIPKPWFEYTIKHGEDINFLEKAKEAGFKILIDPRIPVGHTTLTEIGIHDHVKYNNPEVQIEGNKIG